MLYDLVARAHVDWQTRHSACCVPDQSHSPFRRHLWPVIQCIVGGRNRSSTFIRPGPICIIHFAVRSTWFDTMLPTRLAGAAEKRPGSWPERLWGDLQLIRSTGDASGVHIGAITVGQRSPLPGGSQEGKQREVDAEVSGYAPGEDQEQFQE